MERIANREKLLQNYLLSWSSSFLRTFMACYNAKEVTIYTLFTLEPLHSIRHGVSGFVWKCTSNCLSPDWLSFSDAREGTKAFVKIWLWEHRGDNRLLSAIKSCERFPINCAGSSDEKRSNKWNVILERTVLRKPLEWTDRKALEKVICFVGSLINWSTEHKEPSPWPGRVCNTETLWMIQLKTEGVEYVARKNV